MEILEYFGTENKEYWLDKMKESDWGAGRYLYKLLKSGTLKQLVGENTRVLMLTDGNDLVSFCTLAEKDDIQPTDLTPWIGFVYTFPAYRGHRLSESLIKHACTLARGDGYSRVYLSSNEIGLYEKYGFEFVRTARDIWCGETKVYGRAV